MTTDDGNEMIVVNGVNRKLKMRPASFSLNDLKKIIPKYYWGYNLLRKCISVRLLDKVNT